MRYLLTASGMKACDEWTIHQMGMPSPVLMERAALAVADEIRAHWPVAKRILVLCGSGNNGGDGFAAARLLLLEGIRADVYFAGREASLSEDAALQKKIFENYGGKYCRNFEPDEYNVMVDALFGVGLSREITGEYARLVEKINGSDTPVAAVDMPSGICADTGQILGCAVKADMTVTFAFQKAGQLLYPGAEYCGELIIKDIGITDGGLQNPLQDGYPPAFTYDKTDLARLPRRGKHSHKGDYGKVLIIGGSENMAGAAWLAAKAAYRTGCGLVRVLSHESNRIVFQTGLPEALFTPWQQENEPEALLPWADVVCIGPGLGKSEAARALLKKVLLLWKGPMVIDADGLNILAENPEYLNCTQARIIVTPHLREMSRLSGCGVSDILGNLPRHCRSYACKKQLICVLKDARTAVSDGQRLYLNQSGNNGMAVGGSGDVLSGILAGLLARKPADLYETACLAVYLHGLAGDAAHRRLGAHGMMAGDIVESIPEVLKDTEA